MNLWQRTMIALARNARVERVMEGTSIARTRSKQFIGGSDAGKAVIEAARLSQQAILTSLYYLGEYVEDAGLIQRNLDEISHACSLLAERGLQIYVSVDPTQIGSMLSWEVCRVNAERLAQHVGSLASQYRKFVMLDMEDYETCGPTLELFHQLHNAGMPVGVTVQAYLHRTRDDMKGLIDSGAAIRLVKGAFAESSAHACTARKEMTRRYIEFADELLSVQARRAGVYPIFATHDDAVISAILEKSAAGGWAFDAFEFEMLYGVRPSLQKEIVDRGCRLRLYVPFGEHWWPYTARRVGENPRNALLVTRAVLGI